jgi:hypothetical protein
MSTSPEIANFFWHGNISTLEIMCLRSFVENGFHVKLWSYNNIQVDGVESCDAKLIANESSIYAYSQEFASSRQPSLAAFSDIFRFNLLSKYPGWWFDTDCYCLKSSDDFRKLKENRSIVAGYQDQYLVNGAVLHLDTNIAEKLLDKANAICKQSNNNLLGWGSIGPRLLSDFALENSWYTQLYEPKYFYPIIYEEAYQFLDPIYVDLINLKVKDSYCIHLWDSVLTNNCRLDKNNFPTNSFLDSMLRKINENY